jgi:HemX protein
MNLHIGFAVFQDIRIANRLEGQFPFLSDWDKTKTEFVRHRCTKKKTARVDTNHLLGPKLHGFLSQKINYLGKEVRIGQDRSNVSELDPWLREVRDRANRRLDLFEIDSTHESPERSSSVLLMHLDFLGSFIFAADRLWVWLATYCFVLASAYSAYTLFAGKFMAPRLTFGLVVAGFVCQTIFLGIRGHAVGRCPITNFCELLTFLSWSMILIYLLIGSSYRLSLLGVFTAPFAALLSIWGLLQPEPPAVTVKHPVNAWLEAHTSFSIVACGAFALAGLAGLMYLIQERQLKTRRPSSVFFRLPPIRTLVVANSRLLWLGFGLFTVGLGTGFLIGQDVDWRKVAWSLVVWALYGGILLARLRHSMATRWVATLSIVVFGLLLSMFWGIRFISEVPLVR